MSANESHYIHIFCWLDSSELLFPEIGYDACLDQLGQTSLTMCQETGKDNTHSLKV